MSHPDVERVVETLIHDKWKLCHFLRVAADTFRQEAATLRAATKGDSALITQKAALQLAEEFDQYELQATQLHNAVERAHQVKLVSEGGASCN